MIRSFSGPLRLLLVVLAFGATAAAVPAAAQATVVSRGNLTLLPRASWVTYVTRFGGSITPLGTATLNRSNELSTVLGGPVRTTYVIDLTIPSEGAGTLGYTGGIEYAVPSHGISVKLRDIEIVLDYESDPVGDVYAQADYYPIGGSALTGYTRTLIANIDAGAVFSSGSGTHTWTGAPLILTAAGATIFNGGPNGAYARGNPFGAVLFTGSL